MKGIHERTHLWLSLKQKKETTKKSVTLCFVLETENWNSLIEEGSNSVNRVRVTSEI